MLRTKNLSELYKDVNKIVLAHDDLTASEILHIMQDFIHRINTADVVISVSGGIAEVVEVRPEIAVEIIDFDNLGTGDLP